MRRSILVLMALVLLLPAAALKADEAAWSPVRIIVQGYRNVSALVEASLALVNAYHPQPGTSVHITSGLGGWDFTELYIKLSAPGGSYTYLLEVWTKRVDGWHKAIEYSYDDASAGQIVFHPYAFDSITYQPENLHRVEFQHSVSQRQMTLYSQYAVPVSGATKSIGVAIEQGDYVDVYFTAHIGNVGGAGTPDAYLFGARVEKAAPHRCTAKQGLRDQGDTYDFTYFGAANPVNNGHFAETGWVEDAQSLDGSYPAASGVDPANLPSSAAVSAVSVSFASPADPVF